MVHVHSAMPLVTSKKRAASLLYSACTAAVAPFISSAYLCTRRNITTSSKVSLTCPPTAWRVLASQSSVGVSAAFLGLFLPLPAYNPCLKTGSSPIGVACFKSPDSTASFPAR